MKLRKDEWGFPWAIDDDEGNTVIHLNASSRTCDNAQKIVDMLNEVEKLRLENTNLKAEPRCPKCGESRIEVRTDVCRQFHWCWCPICRELGAQSPTILGAISVWQPENGDR